MVDNPSDAQTLRVQVPVSYKTPDLQPELYEELVSSIVGTVHLRDDPNFAEYSKMFNGNVESQAKAVVCPVDAKDVSRIILFCKKHCLSPSIKSGGYGTAGWAICGDIILDLNRISDIDIEVPHPEGAFTSIRDMPTASSKGKGRAGALVTDTSASAGKRRREEDMDLRVYDAASHNVANFLRGPSLDQKAEDVPSPLVRRRLDTAQAQLELPIVRQTSSDSSASTLSDPHSTTSGSHDSRDLTTNTSPSPSLSNADAKAANIAPFSGTADPFGYLDDAKPGPLPTLQQTSHRPQVTLRSWDATPSYLPPTVGSNLNAFTAGLFVQPQPLHSHSYVTFGAGKRQKEIDQYTAQHPLEATSLQGQRRYIPYHVPFAAHPAGSSIMVLAGFGFLSRLHGLSIDNLVEVEMVLADGSIVIVSEKENLELWWAVRGAGSSFGVATRYKARAYPVPIVFAGNLIYRFHRATAPSLIKHFRDCIKGAPRELYANCILTAGPANKDSLVIIQMCYVGPREKGQEYLQAISSWDGETCLLNEVDEKIFLHQQDSVAQVLRGKTGRQWFIRSVLINSLPDDVINKTVIQFSETPVGCTWLFELAGGAISDFEDTCLPKTQREASFTVAALHQWEMGVDDPRCKTSAEEWINDTLGPVTTGGPYPSFLGRHEPPERTMACYGDNWSRLVELKRQYDPTNFFRNTFWPLDANGNPIEAETHEPASPLMSAAENLVV